MSPAETNGAPVRRGDQARHRILGAALEQLADEGATGFTMEAIARRAGASKATLYRRWPSASALLVDAMATTYRPLAAPDTGDARTDLQLLLDQVVVLFTRTRFPRLMAAIIDLAERDPALVKLHADQTARQRQPVLEILRRGQERGQLQAQADLETLTDVLTAPFFYRRLIAHRPIPPTMPEAIIGCIFPGRRHGEPGVRLARPMQHEIQGTTLRPRDRGRCRTAGGVQQRQRRRFGRDDEFGHRPGRDGERFGGFIDPEPRLANLVRPEPGTP